MFITGSEYNVSGPVIMLIYWIYIHQWPSMQIVLASTWSLTNICNFSWPCGTILRCNMSWGWIAIECHNCCMNGRNLWILHVPSSSPILDVPTPFSNLGKSQIFLLTCPFWSCSWARQISQHREIPLSKSYCGRWYSWPRFQLLVECHYRCLPYMICAAWSSSPLGHSPSLQLSFHFMI